MPKTKSKVRVRLTDKKNSKAVAAMAAARDKSYKEAPRTANGRIIPGYSYKATLEGYRESGLKPTIIGINSPSPKPMFVVQPSLGKRIVKLIRAGHPYTTVCRAVGVSPKVFKDWLEKGKAGLTEDYHDLYVKVCKAEAYAEMRQLRALRKHESADWRVSAWQLERRWPEHWSKKDRVVAEMHVNGSITTDSKEQLGTKVLEDSVARELARKMIDGDAFDYNSVALPSPEEKENI